MPTYHSLDTKVQLCVASLTGTTTAIPQRRKDRFTTSEATKAETKLKKGRALKETALTCFGGEDSRLHFLGLNSEVPFFLVHAGDDLFRTSHEETVAERAQAVLKEAKETQRQTSAGERSVHSRRSSSLSSAMSIEPPDEEVAGGFSRGLSTRPHVQTRTPSEALPPASSLKGAGFMAGSYNPQLALRPSPAPSLSKQSKPPARRSIGSDVDLAPQALGLVVTLSRKSFMRGFDEKHAPQDVKIEVLFNGELAECITVPARKSSDSSATAQDLKIQLISGKRVHRLVERPWVIIPPQQNADGSLRTKKGTKAAKATPQQRWKEIAAAILTEAETKGFNEHGDCTPSGSYLASLARLEMPDVLHRMQKLGGPKFGVIDVIVSVGSGKKGPPDTFYLVEPTRLVDERFKARVGGFDRTDGVDKSTCATASGERISIATILAQELPKAESSRAASALSKAVFRSVEKGRVDVTTNEYYQIEHDPPSGTAELQLAGIEEVEARRIELGHTDSKPRESTIRKFAEERTNKDVATGMAETIIAPEARQSTTASLLFNEKEAHSKPPATNEATREAPATPPIAFPSFPSVESIDFAKIINISPTRDENERRNRSLTLQSQTSDVVVSSPEDGRHRRGGIRIKKSAVDNFATHSAGKGASNNIMAPPQSPMSPFNTTSKHHRSDATLHSDVSPPKRRRNSATVIDEYSPLTSPGNKTVSGYMGMSRRGVISKRKLSAASPLSKAVATLGAVNPSDFDLEQQSGLSTQTKKDFISRVVIKAKDTVIIDKAVAVPFQLQDPVGAGRKALTSAISLLYPLDESVVFGLRDMVHPALPVQKSSNLVQTVSPQVSTPVPVFTPPNQIATPVPSSSPVRSENLEFATAITLPPPSRHKHNTVTPGPSSNLQPPTILTSLSVLQSKVKPEASPSRQAQATRAHRPRSTVQVPPRGIRKEGPTFKEELKQAWKTPELSDDCVITYAEERSGEESGVVRHIKSARPGSFRESGVLFGVRYLVG